MKLVVKWFLTIRVFRVGAFIAPIFERGIEDLMVLSLILIGAYCLKKSYEAIASRTGVDLFRITGLLHFISALVYLQVAYFSPPEEPPSEQVLI